jgi:hypothetical protein
MAVLARGLELAAFSWFRVCAWRGFRVGTFNRHFFTVFCTLQVGDDIGRRRRYQEAPINCGFAALVAVALLTKFGNNSTLVYLNLLYYVSCYCAANVRSRYRGLRPGHRSRYLSDVNAQIVHSAQRSLDPISYPIPLGEFSCASDFQDSRKSP